MLKLLVFLLDTTSHRFGTNAAASRSSGGVVTDSVQLVGELTLKTIVAKVKPRSEVLTGRSYSQDPVQALLALN